MSLEIPRNLLQQHGVLDCARLTRGRDACATDFPGSCQISDHMDVSMSRTPLEVSWSDSVRPIQRTDLVAQVTSDLRRRILEGELPADSELPSESRLAEMFDVSRTVVREAMRNLRGQGLVEVGRGRKPRIKPVGPQPAIEALNAMLRRADGSLLHLLEVRRALESEVAYLAAQRASPTQIEMLAQTNEQLLAAADLEQRISCDWRFHERLAEATNNPLFVLLVRTVGGLFEDLMRRTAHSDTQVVYAGHARLLKAIRERHADEARRIALDNLESTRRDLREADESDCE